MDELIREGGCDCRAVRYQVRGRPIIVHCCHCRWCQRETGSAFVLNAVYLAGQVAVTSGAPDVVDTPSASGRGQRIARCPTCRIALWSHYARGGELLWFVRVGTLDDPDALPPDVHIYTASKQPWVALPPGARSFEQFYEVAEVWPAESLERFRQARARATAE